MCLWTEQSYPYPLEWNVLLFIHLFIFIHLANMLSIYSVTDIDLGTEGPRSEQNKVPAPEELALF